MTNPFDSLIKNHAAKARREARKANAIKGAADEYTAQHPELVAFLAESRSWSEFAMDMHMRITQGRGLSTKQELAAYSMREKVIATQEARARAIEVTTTEVDLSGIRAMFENAVSSGYKKPTYRADGLIINRAPDHGNNPGALYVKSTEGNYLGKILGITYTPNRDGREAGTADVLKTIAIDPLAAALRYGQKTGNCACCGRLLKAHKSIDLGIGPVCKERWGL